VDSSSDAQEIEWQFDGADTAVAREWLGRAVIPGYRIEGEGTKDLDDAYFDTPDWRINHAGFTCRVRRKGTSAELTLKSMAETVEGIRSRREVTERLALTEPIEPTCAPGVCGEMLRAVSGRRPLEQLFRVKTNRATFALHDAVSQVAEIAVDATTITGGVEEARLERVEVEIAGGSVERARRFVDVMVAALGLKPSETSKFGAGLAASGHHVPPKKPSLGVTEIDAGMSAGEVAYAVLRKQFAVFVMSEPGTRLGEDIEALHDMRVATRRLRAAMSLFEPYLAPRLQAYREQFGWVADVLGEVRDLDVQLERMADWREGLAEEQAHALDSIDALLVERREAARKRLLAALNSRRYESLVSRFATVLKRGSPRSFAPAKPPALTVAPALVAKRYRQLRKAGDDIGPRSPASDYHALRIRGKKLRYAVEFFGSLYGRPATEFAERLTALQDLLGLHQDAEVAETMLAEIANGRGRRLGPATLMAMGAIAERYRQHAQELRHEFPGTYEPLTRKAWRALRKAMAERRDGIIALQEAIRRPGPF
jgi:CHAD domain-containing protein